MKLFPFCVLFLIVEATYIPLKNGKKGLTLPSKPRYTMHTLAYSGLYSPMNSLIYRRTNMKRTHATDTSSETTTKAETSSVIQTPVSIPESEPSIPVPDPIPVSDLTCFKPIIDATNSLDSPVASSEVTECTIGQASIIAANPTDLPESTPITIQSSMSMEISPDVQEINSVIAEPKITDNLSVDIPDSICEKPEPNLDSGMDASEMIASLTENVVAADSGSSLDSSISNCAIEVTASPSDDVAIESQTIEDQVVDVKEPVITQTCEELPENLEVSMIESTANVDSSSVVMPSLDTSDISPATIPLDCTETVPDSAIMDSSSTEIPVIPSPSEEQPEIVSGDLLMENIPSSSGDQEASVSVVSKSTIEASSISSKDSATTEPEIEVCPSENIPENTEEIPSCDGENPEQKITNSPIVSKEYVEITEIVESCENSSEEEDLPAEDSFLCEDIAEVNQFPYQAAIIVDGEAFCGGSLIHPRWVMTAGHCVYGFSNWMIRLGSNQRRGKDSSTQVMFSNKAFVHKEFNEYSLHNDIAVIKLPQPVNLGDNIQVVRLSKSFDYTPPDTLLKVSGFGVTNKGTLSTSLRYANLTAITNTECEEAYHEDEVLSDSTICCRISSQDTKCFGDSGGPLVQYDELGCPVQVGIASFVSSLGCGPETPSGFTRITSYPDWIYENTEGDVVC